MMMWGLGPGGMWLWMVLVWVVVIGGIVWAVTQFSRGSDRGSGTADDGARRILDERFARGDIDAEEYRALRDELTR